MKWIAVCVSVIFVAAFTPGSFADEAAGQKVYDAKCKSCHGKTGEGNPAIAKALKVDPSVFLLTKLDKTDDELTEIITNGKGKMPAFKSKLSEDEIKDVVKYVRSLSQK